MGAALAGRPRGASAFASWHPPQDVPRSAGLATHPPFRGTPSTGRLASVNDNATGDQSGGVYLDEEAYLQAEEGWLQPDGSLDLDGPRERMGGADGGAYAGPSPPPAQRIKNKTYQSAAEGLLSPPPSYSYPDGDGIQQPLSNSQQELSDEERLYQIAQDIESGKNAPQIDPEALHQQVFAEEQTYLQQSERFRKSLSSLDDNDESPMAQERREVIEDYNEKVLDDLMKEMEAMESMAISREEALARADEERKLSLDDQAKDAVCTKCGLRVTPDMVERAEMIQIAQGGGVEKKKGVEGGLLCEACYGQRFKSKDEARVRLGAGSSYGEYSGNNHAWQQERGGARMYDRNNAYRPRSRRRRDVTGRKGRRSDVQGIDTSSLFEVPKGDASNSETMAKESKDTNRSSRTMHKDEVQRPSPAKPSFRQQSRPPRRSSRALGGGELAKRMQQQEPDAGSADDQNAAGAAVAPLIQSQPSPEIRMSEQDDGILDAAVDNPNAHAATYDDGGQWVKVEDPASKRALYWNTETGDMKQTLD